MSLSLTKYIIAPARAPIESAPMPPPTCPKLGPETARAPPDVWSPRISLERVIQEQPLLLDRQFSGSNGTSHFQLVPCEIIFRGDEPRVFLEESYQIEGAYPRGFFVAMAKRELQHNFVFRHPDHPYFEDLYGLRRVKTRQIIHCYRINSNALDRALISP